MILDVYTFTDKGKLQRLGTAESFGAAKRMQQDSLPDDLKEAYAGISEGMPLFYTELLTPFLLEKYPWLKSRDVRDSRAGRDDS